MRLAILKVVLLLSPLLAACGGGGTARRGAPRERWSASGTMPGARVGVYCCAEMGNTGRTSTVAAYIGDRSSVIPIDSLPSEEIGRGQSCSGE